MNNERLKGWGKFRSIDRGIITIHIAIIGFYLLYFWVICQSSYGADDMLNSNAKALDYIQGDSVFKLTARQFSVWFERGRFFPFSNYCYVLFAYLPSRFAYKFLIVVTIYLNNLLFGKCIQKISKSKELGLLTMVVFPLCIQLTGEFNSALYCYHMLIQNTFMWLLISTLLVFKYIDQIRNGDERIRNYWYLVVGAFFLFMSLGTYETGFILVSFMGLAIWAYTGNLTKTLKVLTPNILTYIITILINVYLRSNVSSEYSGIEISLNPRFVFDAYLKQCASTVPFARFLSLKFLYNNGVSPYSREDMLDKLKWSDILMIALFIVSIAYILKLLFKRREKIHNILFVLLSGLSLLLLPPLLIAISSRYQQELLWGQGHISGYVQSFGLLLILLTPIILLVKYCKPIISKIIIGILILLSVPIILFQQMESRVVIESNWSWFGYPRENVEIACDFGLLDSVTPDDILMPVSEHYFDYAEPEVFYTYAAKSETKILIKSEISANFTENYGIKSSYNLHNTNKRYFAVTSEADKKTGYVILGECTNINLDEDQVLESIYVKSALIFVRGNNHFNLEYNSNSGKKTLESSNMKLLKSDGYESMYRIEDIEFDILSVSFER